MGKHSTAVKLLLAASLALVSISWAGFRTSSELVSDMGFGYNLGNTLEVPVESGGVTGWGNTFPTQELFDSVAAAGFSSVRLPTAWYSHSTVSGSGSSATCTIDANWLDSIADAVDMCRKAGLYVVLNSHWDTGWLEDNVFSSSDTAAIRTIQSQVWTQIATKFANYSDSLLFAGANEPGVNDSRLSGGAEVGDYDGDGQVDFNAERAEILQRYQQAFIDAVRGVSGNEQRTLIIQVPRTNYSFYDTLALALPTDKTNGNYSYMMTEFHYYPYNFSLMEEDATWDNAFYYLGEENLSTDDTDHNAPTAANEWLSPDYMKAMLDTAASKTSALGMPAIIGEFGAIKRTAKSYGLDSTNLRKHLNSRAYFYNLVAAKAKDEGMVPFLWDTGNEGSGNMTVIRRQTTDSVGQVFDYEVLNAMRRAYGLSEIDGNSSDALVEKVGDTTNYAIYTEIQSENNVDSSSTTTIRVTPDYTDWSSYEYITVVMLLYGSSVTCEAADYGYASADFFLMSGNWVWSQYHLTSETSDSSFVTYTFKISDLSGETISDQSNINAIGVNVYSSCWEGIVMVDGVYLSGSSGTTLDTAAAFSDLITLEGNASNTQLVAVGGVLDSSVLGETIEAGADTTNYAVITEVANVDTNTYTLMGFNPSITDWTAYDSVAVVMLLYGSTTCSESGTYGWTSTSLSTLSGSNYDWAGNDFTSSSTDSSYVTYTFPIDTLDISDKSAVYYTAINLYSQCFDGVLAVDGFYLIKADGTVDTLNAFSSADAIEVEGDASNTQVVSVADGSVKVPIKPSVAAVSSKIRLSLHDGLITAVFESSSSKNATVMLTNSLGQVVSKKSFRTSVGANTVNLTTPFRGAGYLVIKNGSSQSAVPIRIRQ